VAKNRRRDVAVSPVEQVAQPASLPLEPGLQGDRQAVARA